MNTEVTLSKLGSAMVELHRARRRIAREAVKFSTVIPHVCEPGWKFEGRTRIADGVRDVWTLAVTLDMGDVPDREARAMCSSLCASLRFAFDYGLPSAGDFVDILDHAGVRSGSVMFKDLPEAIQRDLKRRLVDYKHRPIESQPNGRDWGPECPLDDEFKPREVKPQFRDLTSEYVCGYWNRGVRVAKCDNPAGDTHYYVFDVATGEATARVASLNDAFDRARDHGSVTNG